MKVRYSILSFCAAILGLIVLIIWIAMKPTTAIPIAGSTNPVGNITGAPEQPKTNRAVEGHQATASILNVATNAPRKSKEQQTLEILSTQNNIPIIFFGRLEDQFGNPVVGAEITGSTVIYNGARTGSERVSTISDANGFFRIDAGKGESLGIMPKKEGYALATTGTLFKYSQLESHPYVSDQNNPSVIKMWKLQGAEPLIGIDKAYKIYYTNVPIHFDLIAGQIVPHGGDIKLTVKRLPGVISGRNRLDWSVQIEAVDGGVMDSGGQEEVTYVAPEDGYQASMAFMFSTNAPYKWAGGFNQGFFVKSRNGQVYSKLGLSFRINETPDDFMYINFGGIANTNGSRNWEGDPNTMKAAGQ